MGSAITGKTIRKAQALQRFRPVGAAITGNKKFYVSFSDDLPPLMWPHHATYTRQTYYFNTIGIQRPALDRLFAGRDSTITLPRKLDPNLPDRMSYFRARLDMGAAWLRFHQRDAFVQFCKSRSLGQIWRHDVNEYNADLANDNIALEFLLIFEKARCDVLMAKDLDGAATNIRQGLITYGQEIQGMVERIGSITLTPQERDELWRRSDRLLFSREATYFAALTYLNPNLVHPTWQSRLHKGTTNKEVELHGYFSALADAVNDPEQYWLCALKIIPFIRSNGKAALDRSSPAFSPRTRVVDPRTKKVKIAVPGGTLEYTGEKLKREASSPPNQTASAVSSLNNAGHEQSDAAKIPARKSKTGNDKEAAYENGEGEGDKDSEALDLGETDAATLALMQEKGSKGRELRAKLTPPEHWGEVTRRKSRKPLPAEDDGRFMAYDIKADQTVKPRDLLASGAASIANRRQIMTLLARQRKPALRISRELRRLFPPKDSVPTDIQPFMEEGDLDFRALSTLIMDPTYPTPYRKVEEQANKKTVAIKLLVDVSKSMSGFPIPDHGRERNVHPKVKQETVAAALMIARACELANIPCEIVAITTGEIPSAFETDRNELAELGRIIRYAPLRHAIVKSFDRQVRRSIPNLGHLLDTGNGNADAASIIHEHNTMLRRTEDHRFVVMLTDMIAHSGYYFPSIAPDYNHFEGAECTACAKENTDHLTQAAKQIYTDSSIHLIGFGFGPQTYFQASSFYPRNVSHPPDGDLVTTILTKLLPIFAACIAPKMMQKASHAMQAQP